MRPRLPNDFSELAARAWSRARAVDGDLDERELRALVMLAAAAASAAEPPRSGAVVEVARASAQFTPGRAAIALSTVIERLGLAPLISVVPEPAGAAAANAPARPAAAPPALTPAEIIGSVEIRPDPSVEPAREWSRPIGFLWIDGGPGWESTRRNFEGFASHLQPGGFVALGGALRSGDGPLRVFLECVLASDQFGPAGFLRTIAWAQYRPSDGGRWRRERQQLSRRARRLLPLTTAPARALRARAALALVPHRVPSPERWISRFMPDW